MEARKWLVLSQLDPVAVEPASGVLDQVRQHFPQPFDGVANLFGVHIRGGMLKSTFEHIGLMQQQRLYFCQAAIGADCLEDLVGMGTPMRQPSCGCRAAARRSLGQLLNGLSRRSHLPAVGALSAGADRAAAFAQLPPLLIAIDEHPALV